MEQSRVKAVKSIVAEVSELIKKGSDLFEVGEKVDDAAFFFLAMTPSDKEGAEEGDRDLLIQAIGSDRSMIEAFSRAMDKEPKVRDMINTSCQLNKVFDSIKDLVETAFGGSRKESNQSSFSKFMFDYMKKNKTNESKN